MRRAETATPTWADYRAEFPIFESTTYLNTCSLAPLSRRVAAAVGEYLRLWQQFGASAWSGPWWEEIATLRRRAAQVIGADASEVALFPHVTTAPSPIGRRWSWARTSTSPPGWSRTSPHWRGWPPPAAPPASSTPTSRWGSCRWTWTPPAGASF